MSPGDAQPPRRRAPAGNGHRRPRAAAPPRWRLRTRLLLAAMTMAAAAIGAPCATRLRLRLNASASLPRGLYRLQPGAPARPGDLVLACAPPAFARWARARHYLWPGDCPGGAKPLGKLLMATAGDLVEVTPARIVLNGRPLPATATAASDAAGRPLPHLAAGPWRVGRGELWLLAPHPRSLDSRYFGPVLAPAVRGRLAPVAVAGGADLARLAREIRRAHGAAEHRGGRTRGDGPRTGS